MLKGGETQQTGGTAESHFAYPETGLGLFHFWGNTFQDSWSQPVPEGCSRIWEGTACKGCSCPNSFGV